ncbi:hypothetical protein F5Y19DRAFT_348223 [Xylariaceae sp. FL1651]|nr:hypothetical protein F5Y19DRAFT_348223 [Xylariaceae sp. FL1651]
MYAHRDDYYEDRRWAQEQEQRAFINEMNSGHQRPQQPPPRVYISGHYPNRPSRNLSESPGPRQRPSAHFDQGNIHHGRPRVRLAAEPARAKWRARATLPGWVDPQIQSDDEGGFYRSRDPQAREVYPSPENVQNTTSNYYSGGLGDAAWRRKKRKRAGLQTPNLEPDPDPGLEPPQHPSIHCFVTIRGKAEFAEPAARFGARFRTERCNDAYLAAFLIKEYEQISTQARWYGRLINFKTIGAVEFQTWKFKDRVWSLAEVDSIPEQATRNTMSHFSYQLRHPYTGARHWVNKLEKLLKAADQMHANGREGSGERWNFRVHIIEIIDSRVIYLAASFAIFPSAAAGIAYGVLMADFSTGFTIASYVLTGFALIFTILATAEFLGIETPDSFMANNVYENLMIDETHFPGERR